MDMSAQEKPQWTTKQVIALIVALSGVIGIGGAKTFDVFSKNKNEITLEKPINQDTAFANIRGDIGNVFNEVLMMRQENRSEHIELREDLRALHNRLRAIEKQEYAEKKMVNIYAKRGE